ncbi:hypothetical protein [Kutzneria sp. NPDC052558]|uniref:hypothetical protein n=1 Tax=Kutzneria sp. NPDC052558 TaxID=3364121 RepID=UPI0037C8BF8F
MDGLDHDSHTDVLVALLHAVGATTKAVTQRAAQLSELVWANAAVRDVIQSVVASLAAVAAAGS